MRHFLGDTCPTSKFMSMPYDSIERSRAKMSLIPWHYPYLQALIQKRFKCIITYESNIINGDECWIFPPHTNTKHVFLCCVLLPYPHKHSLVESNIEALLAHWVKTERRTPHTGRCSTKKYWGVLRFKTRIAHSTWLWY